jgi:hypothetical protein
MTLEQRRRWLFQLGHAENSQGQRRREIVQAHAVVVENRSLETRITFKFASVRTLELLLL